MSQRNYGRGLSPARKLATVVIIAFACIAVIPAVASANTAWVSEKPIKAPFNKCSSPGFNNIQAAIETPVTEVHVCAGTYEEQLTIKKAVSIVGSLAVVKLPGSATLSTTACDVQEPGYEEQDLVTICGTGTVEPVKISGVTFNDSAPAGPECGKQFFGILVGGKIKLAMTNSTVAHAGANPINGCQQGVAVQVGHKYQVNTVGTASLVKDRITGYQKNGITVDNAGSKATIKEDMITTSPTAEIANNGIQISRGAEANVVSSQISGNECNAPSCGSGSMAEEEEDATGVLFFEEAKGSVTNSGLLGNDIGIYHYGQCCVGTVQATITGNTLQEDRFWGMVLDQGWAKVSKNKIIGNNAAKTGIQLIQYLGQEFGAKGKGNEDEITGTECAVEGFSDNNGSDQFASVTLTNSLAKFSGNTENTCNNNTNGKLVIAVS